MTLKKILCALTLILYLNSAFAQSGWYTLATGFGASLYSIKMLNSETGWTAGTHGKIFKTTNSGVNWVDQSISTTNNIYDIEILTSSIVFACGENGLIMRTTNSGINWNIENLAGAQSIGSISFISQLTGFACGINGLWKTTNSGVSWNEVNFTDSIYQFTGIEFFDNLIGWIGTSVPRDSFQMGPQSRVYKTTDGGNIWIAEYDFPEFDYINSMYFVDSLIGFISARENVTGGSIIFKTINGGMNWQTLSFPLSNPLFSISFYSPIKGWVVGDSRFIYATSNGGLNWNLQYTDVFPTSFYSCYSTDSLTVYVTGNGRILKTTTGGLTYTANSNTEIPDKYSLSQNYPNPFNPKTIIKYSVSSNVRHQTSNVRLILYNSLGIEAAVLLNEKKPPGSYEVEFDGSNLPSGIYFYLLEVDGNAIDAKRMVLVK